MEKETTIIHSRRIKGLLNFSSNTANHGISCFTLVLLLSSAIPYVGAQSNTNQTDPYQYATFSPSMAIIVVVLVAALFFMGFFSIYIRHCSNSRNGGSVRPVVGGQADGRSRRANRGLDQAVIDTFPTFAYSAVKGLKIGKGALECAVCLNEFEDDETLRLLPKCDHVFHPECIDAWLSSHTTCPVCRANLAIPADETAATATGEMELPALDLNDNSDEATQRSNTNELQNSVSIRVTDDQSRNDQVQQAPLPEVIQPSRSVRRSRSIKSIIFSKFPRSHSTGHSLIQPGENVDRFTLRLPQDVRKQIMNRSLNRTTSLLVLPRETSSRRGYRTGNGGGGGEGSSRGKSYRRLDSLDQVARSDRWVFSMAPPFFSRAPSIRSPRLAANDGEGTSSMASRGFITSLKKSFGRLNSKGAEPGLVYGDSARPPV